MKSNDRFNMFFGDLPIDQQQRLKPTLEAIFKKCYEMGFRF